MSPENFDADDRFSQKRTDSRDVDEESVLIWLEKLAKEEAQQQKKSTAKKPMDPSKGEMDEDAETIGELAVKGSPYWLFSIAFHLLLLILLTLVFSQNVTDDSSPTIDVTMYAETQNPDEILYAEMKGEQLEVLAPLMDIDDQPISIKVDVDMPEVAASNIFSSTKTAGTISTYHGQGFDPANIQLSSMLTGRVTANHGRLLKAYGGNATTEEAVQRGLKWLAKNQIKEGSRYGYWSLKGPYSNGGGFTENTTAATAMALIAFQGNGHTHWSSTEYSNLVNISWNWMLKQQNDEGAFVPMGTTGYTTHRFYTHALATIALCEIYGMTGDRKFLEPAQRALYYFFETQGESGGWRYDPKEEADLSVTGWCVIALKSAQMAKLKVPEKNLEKIRKFLDNVGHEDGSRYGYMIGFSPTLAMTAEGLLARQFLGWKHDDSRLRRGADWLIENENLVSYTRGRRNSYYWYYATQVMHHLGGKYWMTWNNQMRQEVPKAQVQDKNDPEFGSWSPSQPIPEDFSAQASVGGRLYITCLSIYMLEVYYRHLPIYRDSAVQ